MTLVHRCLPGYWSQCHLLKLMLSNLNFHCVSCCLLQYLIFVQLFFFGVLVNRGAHNSEGVSSSNISKEYGSFWRSTSDEFDVLLNAFPLTESRSETPRFSPLLINDSPKTWIDVLPARDVPRFPSSLFSTLVSETSVSIVGRSFWEYGISFEYVLTT